ncbi:MAG: hypothetical protein ABSH34_02660 [Verrucomicrobiota bacterium]
MKYANAVGMSAVVIWLAGCASAPKVVVQEPVGPCHGAPSEATKDGALQVYSARAKADVDLSMEEWRWNNDFGKNQFLYAPSHTGFTLSLEGGKVLQHVSNARSLNDENPALVELPPGSYTVEAEAEEPGGRAMTVVVPLVVRPGQTTAVHLEPGWKPSGELPDPNRLVRLADGRIIGCRAQEALTRHLQSAARAQFSP